VGVVEDIRAFGLDLDPEPAFYIESRQVPAWRGSSRGRRLAVRTQGDASGVIKALKPAILSVNSSAQVRTIDRMSDLVAHSIGGRGSPRLMMLVSSLFGALTLLLAMSGLFGIVLHTVAQRMPEIGVRIALGADRGDVARLLFGYAGRIIIGGVALGTTAAWASARALRAFVFGVTPTDPATYALSIGLLVLCVVAACVIPIRRAMRCDPTTLLRA
jgi:putative ABC transport system permease protein